MHPWPPALVERRPARRRTKPPRAALLPLAMALGLALLTAPGEASARTDEQLLILPIEHGLGADAERLRQVEDAFRAEVEALGRYGVAAPEQAALLLDSVRSMGLECEAGDLECLTKAGVVMEIDLIVVLRAVASEERLIVSAVLVDVHRGRTRASVHRSLPLDASLAAAMRGAAVELLAPDLFVGSLLVEVKEPGATIRVDGLPRGRAPLERPIEGLAPGEHVLHVEKRGFEPMEQLVIVEPLAVREVTIALTPVGASSPPALEVEGPLLEDAEPSPSPTPPVVVDERKPSAPVLPLALSGAAAVGSLVSVGLVTGALLMSLRAEDTSLSAVEREGARDAHEALLVGGLVASGVTLGAAVGAGASWFWE